MNLVAKHTTAHEILMLRAHVAGRFLVDLLQFVPVFAYNYGNFFNYLSTELNYFTFIFIGLNCSIKK